MNSTNNPIAWGQKDDKFFIVIDAELLKTQESYTTSDMQSYYSLSIPLNSLEIPLEIHLTETDIMVDYLLVGYIRRSNAGGVFKLSLNKEAIEDAQSVVNSQYLGLSISLASLVLIANGVRSITTAQYDGAVWSGSSLNNIQFINWREIDPFDTK